MRVIVTGASGFIGRHVLLRAPRGWQVVAVTRRPAEVEAFIAERGLRNVEALRCDLTVEADVTRLAEAAGRDAHAILYLAANGDPAVSVERPAWDLQSNAVALVNLLEHVRAERIVFVSSGAVYDGANGGVTPATPVAPALPYAISKLASEQYVRFFAERRRTVKTYVNVRFFGAYGPYEAERKITTRWLRAVTNGDREFAIRGDGRNLIDFMYVDDAVDGLIALTDDRQFSGTVDFGGGAPVTVNEVIDAMRRIAGDGIVVAHQGRTEEYIRFRTVDDTMRTRFGFTPRVTFPDGFARLRQFLQARDAAADGRGGAR